MTMTLIDAVGTAHRPLERTETPRIVSLVPSLTELLCDLGLAGALVGRTGFCIHPADTVRGIAKVGGTKDVNLDKLRRLAPTHVVVNVDENRLETAEALRGFVPHVLVTHPCGPHDVPALVGQMAQAFGDLPGVAGRARALRDELSHELAITPAAGFAPQPVLYLI